MNSRKKKIGIIDITTNRKSLSPYWKIFNANYSSIMPQSIAVWCQEEGHDVNFVCHTGFGDLTKSLPADLDLVFIGAFTHSAQLVYALSNLLRLNGAVTVLGGPHARCYPEDALKYFDYVLGFTDKKVIQEVLLDCSRHRPMGIYVSANKQPASLPSVRERWPFIQPILKRVPLLKAVPMLGSTGCPYTCSFCIDADIPYQPLDFDAIKDDLVFLLRQYKRPTVAWHDPNFGVRFDDYLGVIEEAVPPNSIRFIAESSLSILSRKDRLERLKRNGFKALLPGIESWYDLGNKSKTGSRKGIEKVRKVSAEVNAILEHIPYVQTNFVVGLDSDQGPEPFKLTKMYADLTPNAYPAYNLITAYGRAAPVNLEYQRANRVIPLPFHFMNNDITNVRPQNYSWIEFYRHVVDMGKHLFAWESNIARCGEGSDPTVRILAMLRGISTRLSKTKRTAKMLRQLETDVKFRAYFEQETDEIPRFFVDQIRKDLGPLWQWLPKGALQYDHNAYLKSELENDLAISP